jgi:thymidylate synthase
MSLRYAGAEFLWYLSGQRRIEMIKYYAPQYSNYADGPFEEAWGAYGYRWAQDAAMRREAGDSGVNMSQLDFIVNTLRRDPSSRQAILTMWNAGDLVHASLMDKRDLPCTLSIQFLLRHGRLHAITTMRSNDLWYGFPYDVFCFCMLQCYLADILGVKVGTYCHQVGSLHLYEKQYLKIRSLVEQPVNPELHDLSFLHDNDPSETLDACLNEEHKIRAGLPYCAEWFSVIAKTVIGQAFCMAIGDSMLLEHECAAIRDYRELVKC